MITLKTLPLSTNRMFYGKKVLTQEARDFKRDVYLEAKNQWRGRPITGPVALILRIFWPDKRRRDADNLKLLIDAFSGLIYEDDSQVQELHITKGVDKKHPRVEIEVVEL